MVTSLRVMCALAVHAVDELGITDLGDVVAVAARPYGCRPDLLPRPVPAVDPAREDPLLRMAQPGPTTFLTAAPHHLTL